MIALTIILGYALMIWITSLIFGILSWDNDDEMDGFEWVMAVIWPLGLLLCLITGLGNLFNWLWGKIPGRNAIEFIVEKLCIIFKPFKIGTMIRGWIQRRN